MIIIYPMLTSPNISQNSLPGIIKAIEKYILVYNIDDVLRHANLSLGSVVKTGTIIVQAGTLVLAAYKAAKGVFEQDNLFLFEQNPGTKLGWQDVKDLATKAGQKSKEVIDKGKSMGFEAPKVNGIDLPRKDTISLEPTWVTINSNVKGTQLLGVKVVPFTIHSDGSLMKLISNDIALTKLDLAIETYKRKAKRLLYSLMRGLKIPFIKDRALTGNTELDVLWAGTKHSQNLFICLNSIEIENSNIFSNPAMVNKLHGLGWSSLVLADDVNKKVTFCMKEFGGMCSTVPYSFIYAASGKEEHEAYKNLDDIKHSAGPFFRLNSKRSKIFSNIIAKERLEKYSSGDKLND